MNSGRGANPCRWSINVNSSNLRDPAEGPQSPNVFLQNSAPLAKKPDAMGNADRLTTSPTGSLRG
jgi:hypothetical protein